MTTLNLNQCGKLFRYNVEYFSLASTPHEEKCTQAGENSGPQILECEALAEQILRMYGKCKDADLFIISNDHEFGRYYELGVMYKEMPEDWEDENEPEAWEPLAYAQKLESGIPDKWDSEAIKFLEENEHPYFVTKVVPMYKVA